MYAAMQRVHFVGIGGIGMSGIAEIVLSLGYPVSGSDLRRSAVTDRLQSLGATIYEGHRSEQVLQADVVVTSTAVPAENPEVAEARLRRIPVIPRAEMLSELMRLKFGIAIAGMHGKTTTTTMVAAVLAAGNLDPTVVVGGRVDLFGSNARAGASRYLVAEADESDRSFLKLSPILSVVTNLDREHMDSYTGMADVENCFVEFMNKVPFYGAVTACIDDPLLHSILPRVTRRVLTYGAHEDAAFRLMPLPRSGDCHANFHVRFGGELLGPFQLHVPGRHNLLNATAAVAIGTELGIEPGLIAKGLRSFRGVDRRFEHKGSVAGIAVVDDYGHHPTEIRATLAAARECGYGHIHVLFQPHRYSRTRDLMDDFAAAFAQADTVELVPIYAANEQPIDGVDSEALALAIAARGTHVHVSASLQEAAQRVAAGAKEGDLLLTLGAGSVSQAVPLLLQVLDESATAVALHSAR